MPRFTSPRCARPAAPPAAAMGAARERAGVHGPEVIAAHEGLILPLG